MNLGRKRLAEARKAASQHRAQMARKGLLALERQAQLQAQSEAAAAATTSGGSNRNLSVGSKITRRIRSDVIGLKNAFRKSYRDNRFTLFAIFFFFFSSTISFIDQLEIGSNWTM